MSQSDGYRAMNDAFFSLLKTMAGSKNRRNQMSEVLSGCAVRAAIQMERADNDEHYLKCIKLRLEALYELTEAPNLREQISDEISWVEEKLGIAE